MTVTARLDVHIVAGASWVETVRIVGDPAIATGATYAAVIRHRHTGDELAAATASPPTPDPDDVDVVVELDAAATAALPLGVHAWDLVETLPDGTVSQIVEGAAVVTASPTLTPNPTP